MVLSNSSFNWLITQNVDGLHTIAGSKKVSELHGCSKQVICMTCRRKYSRFVSLRNANPAASRDSIQETLLKLNPDWQVKQLGELAPDGDMNVEISDNALANFNLPFCINCGERSILKTDVVFFGGNVPRQVCDECYDKVGRYSSFVISSFQLDSADAMLVLGSSLSVMSGYRFVYYAETRMPVAIVNIGSTRADNLATLKIDGQCSDVLQQLHFK